MGKHVMKGGDLATGLSVFAMMVVVIGLIGLGIWISFKYLVPSMQQGPESSLGHVGLGEIKKSEHDVEIEFSTDTKCTDCVVDFRTTVTYADKQTKLVQGTAEPDAKFVKVDWTRYDTTEKVEPVSMDVTAYLVDTLDKKGPVAKKNYSIMRS